MGRAIPASAADEPSATEVETDDGGRTHDDDASEHHRLEVGARFANYEILGVLGRGAMGIVYDARDVTLERRVALKLLRSPRRRATERLLREARALARLDHPNVVRIWAADVHERSLFIAMELVQGQSLREWLRTPRRWSEVLPILIAAGRGLAAAHAGGVIRRDFKPENVLVGWDGRARVVDFGIARIDANHPEHDIVTHEGSGPHSSSSGELSTDALTEKGSLIGTVLYMSPEQHERELADETSDQFAFCMTLFEAVYGHHPFPARTQPELALKISERQIEFPDDLGTPTPPRWLKRAIVRGLEPNPRDRHPSMSALLAELERHPARRRARRQTAALVGLLGAAVALGVLLPDSKAESECVDVPAELDQQLGEAARQRISDRFAALEDATWARPSAARVERELERFADRWLEAHTNVCEARATHPGPTTSLVRARESCLAAQLDEVAILAELLSEADAAVLMQAPTMVLALPDPARCEGDDPPTAFVASSEAGETLRQQVIRLRWQAGSVGGERARARAKDLVAAARELEAPHERALLAEGLILLALLEAFDGEPEPAEAHLREAKRVALRLDSDSLLLRAEVELGWLLATMPGRVDEAYETLEDAAILIERDGSDLLTRSHWQQAYGETLLLRGELPRARVTLDELVRELESSDQPLSLATALNALARVSIAERELPQALSEGHRAIALIESHLGPTHPLLATPLHNVGIALGQLGRDEEARASLERSAALRRRQVDAARSEGFDRGGERRLADTLIELGNLDSVAGRESAREHYEAARALLEPSDVELRARVEFELGVDHQLRGEHELALESFREALRLARQVHTDDEREVAAARLGVGSCELALGRPAAAREPLEQALTSWPSSLMGTLDEAELRFALARTLVALEGPSERATTLAELARALYSQLGATEAVESIDAAGF